MWVRSKQGDCRKHWWLIEISSHELTARPVGLVVWFPPAILSECRCQVGGKKFQPALRFCWVSPTKESDTRELNLCEKE